MRHHGAGFGRCCRWPQEPLREDARALGLTMRCPLGDVVSFLVVATRDVLELHARKHFSSLRTSSRYVAMCSSFGLQLLLEKLMRSCKSRLMRRRLIPRGPFEAGHEALIHCDVVGDLVIMPEAELYSVV